MGRNQRMKSICHRLGWFFPPGSSKLLVHELSANLHVCGSWRGYVGEQKGGGIKGKHLNASPFPPVTLPK